MNTATVTWINFENNGTFLQAYALQQAIRNMGHNNVILDDRHIQELNKAKPNLNYYIGRIIICIKSFIHMTPPSVSSMTHSYYEDFRKKYLSIYDDIDYMNKFDAYICGSDQIWSPYLPFVGYYYLDFTTKKKIAYAPSVGTRNCNEEYKKKVSHCLNTFSHISTRENTGKELLSQLTNKPVKVVVDPTLLLRREDWDILVNTKIQEDYVFCYFLTPNTWYINHAIELVERNHLRLKIFYTSPTFYKYKSNIVFGGPKEFLTYIKHAKMVLTDSFHATVFSLIFQRDFITYKRFKDGGEKDQNARIYNLLTPLHLVDRFIGQEELQNVENQKTINYDSVQKIMEDMRIDSLSYLKTAFSDE